METLYLLGEQDRIVGVSGYAVRPPQVRREKPRVSAFISADIPKVLALEPDLVLAFSDLQAEIVADLVRAGVEVHVFNQRDVAGILAMIRTLGGLIGEGAKADALAARFERRLADVAARVRPSRPKVYFEEWDDPLISGIGWVSDLISIAGGDDIFPQLAGQKAAKGRIVTPGAVVAADPVTTGAAAVSDAARQPQVRAPATPVPGSVLTADVGGWSTSGLTPMPWETSDVITSAVTDRPADGISADPGSSA